MGTTTKTTEKRKMEGDIHHLAAFIIQLGHRHMFSTNKYSSAPFPTTLNLKVKCRGPKHF